MIKKIAKYISGTIICLFFWKIAVFSSVCEANSLRPLAFVDRSGSEATQEEKEKELTEYIRGLKRVKHQLQGALRSPWEEFYINIPEADELKKDDIIIECQKKYEAMYHAIYRWKIESGKSMSAERARQFIVEGGKTVIQASNDYLIGLETARDLMVRLGDEQNAKLLETCFNYATLAHWRIVSFVKTGAFDTKGHKVPVDLGYVIQNSIKHTSEFTGDFNGLRIVYDFPDTLPQVFMDKGFVVEIALNLTLNAARVAWSANMKNVPLKISGRQEGAWVVIEFEDEGPGFRSERTGELLTPDEVKDIFRRPNYTTKTLDKGEHGLGLGIIETIIIEAGGAINPEQNEPRGAKFIIRLPALPLAPAAVLPVKVDTTAAEFCI